MPEEDDNEMLAGLLLFAIFEVPAAAAAVAGAAVSVPIIIHLLNRRRFRIVEWAAMRFLLAAQKKNARKMRIEQLLLLLVRCLVLFLLVLAMCSVTPWAEALWRWWDPAGGKGLANSSTRAHKILVLDGSFSMGAKAGEGGTAFDKARRLAQEVVEAGTSGDGFSVVLMASPPKRIVQEPSEDARRVAAEIKLLRATHGNADINGTLATVAGLLRASPGKFPAKEVYFLTDMQKASWSAQRAGDLQGALSAFKQTGAKAIFVDCGQDGLSNLAITGLELADPVATTVSPTRLLATVQNYGEARDVALKLFVGKAREKGSDRRMELREVATANVSARSRRTPRSPTSSPSRATGSSRSSPRTTPSMWTTPAPPSSASATRCPSSSSTARPPPTPSTAPASCSASPSTPSRTIRRPDSLLGPRSSTPPNSPTPAPAT
ncbi:MAG: BatA domain-containing protein [Gemmataceae bacterium]|nr:BatA domain-containing protein [Gemmataceae bacterium]